MSYHVEYQIVSISNNKIILPIVFVLAVASKLVSYFQNAG